MVDDPAGLSHRLCSYRDCPAAPLKLELSEAPLVWENGSEARVETLKTDSTQVGLDTKPPVVRKTRGP